MCLRMAKGQRQIFDLRETLLERRLWVAHSQQCMLTQSQRALLELLANAIIPADERDEGARCFAAKIETVHAKAYLHGLETAERLCRDSFGCEPKALTPAQAHELLAKVREKNPGFFKQLRMDISALYLSDPAVWARIGFPGPSIERGGYPDFDQPQAKCGK